MLQTELVTSVKLIFSPENIFSLASSTPLDLACTKRERQHSSDISNTDITRRHLLVKFSFSPLKTMHNSILITCPTPDYCISLNYSKGEGCLQETGRQKTQRQGESHLLFVSLLLSVLNQTTIIHLCSSCLTSVTKTYALSVKPWAQ